MISVREVVQAMPNSLFELNQLVAKAAMGDRYKHLDWELIESRRNQCLALEKENRWKVSSENFLLLPGLMPSSDRVATYYNELNKDLELGQGIDQYIDVHGKDPHLMVPLLKLRKAVAENGFDVNYQVTTGEVFRPYFLVAFASGDGSTLQALVDHFKPHHLIIALSDWQDFATSFWTIDWRELSHQQQKVRGGKLTIGCYKDHFSLLNLLCLECHAGVDHAMVYLPPKGSCSDKAHDLRDKITSIELSQSVTYLGYTIDEHNMVWNSWKTLSCQPRVYRKPLEPMGGRMVVCGSGPSLDKNLEHLKSLSRTHLITACGSNFRTLKEYGIRVDFLALVERADEVLDDIQQVVIEYGSGETRLIMSTTCHHQLLSLFVDGMVYFRPALTPLALFSNGPSEVLDFEGPESINTGVAIAASLGMDELVLVGVDLGARSLEKVRSDSAVGCTVRDLSIEVKGNFGGLVLTSALLRDARMSVESCLRVYNSLSVFNASDGVAIEGAKPLSLKNCVDRYNELEDLKVFDQTLLGEWWCTSSRYTPKRFLSSWISRRPRAEVSSFISSLRRLFMSRDPWSPVLIHEVTQLLRLDVPVGVQFPRRVLRSTIQKLVIAITRQLMVMSKEPLKAATWEKEARKIMVEALGPFEQELYDLCDAVEALPVES